MSNGRVVTWGNETLGGDSSSVVLNDVQVVYSTDYAFAAKLSNVNVVTWGDMERGGDSSTVQLEGVDTIFSPLKRFGVPLLPSYQMDV